MLYLLPKEGALVEVALGAQLGEAVGPIKQNVQS